MNTIGTVLRYIQSTRTPFRFQTNLGMTFSRETQITLATVLHLLILAFCLSHQSPTKHTPQTPKRNAHIKTATITELILKCLQPIGTQMAAAGI